MQPCNNKTSPSVSYETLVLGGVLCLVRNARFGRFASAFLRMSRAKRSFWAVCFCVFANVSYETLVLGGLLFAIGSFSQSQGKNSQMKRPAKKRTPSMKRPGSKTPVRKRPSKKKRCEEMSLVDPCRWGESTTQGEIHRRKSLGCNQL